MIELDIISNFLSFFFTNNFINFFCVDDVVVGVPFGGGEAGEKLVVT